MARRAKYRSSALFPIRLTPGTRRVLRDRGGTSAVEFALASTMIMALLAPVLDLGMAFYRQMQVQAAAQAGAEYAAIHGWDSSGIQTAVTSATPLSVSASPAPSQSCGCANGSSITAATCGTTCPNGQAVGTYVVVGAQSTYRPIVPYSLLGRSTTLQASTRIRIS